MIAPFHPLNPTQASAKLNVSTKALRLYEQRGLLNPQRTHIGWRLYDAKTMERAAGIVALRRLGLSLAQVARVFDGSPREMDEALSLHEIRLNEQAQQLRKALERLRCLRADLAQGHLVTPTDIVEFLTRDTALSIGFTLPWPWAGEWFSLQAIPPLCFITGPLGSGKTRFARALAASLPDASFVGLNRLNDAGLTKQLSDDALLASRVEQRLAWLADDGAIRSDALTALAIILEGTAANVLVIDMVEEGLSGDTQAALMAHLRSRGARKRALFLMTRSSVILDPDALDQAETIILCPANHSSPFKVNPYPGGQGYESLATCVAAPDVRARTAGMTAVHPHLLSIDYL